MRFGRSPRSPSAIQGGGALTWPDGPALDPYPLYEEGEPIPDDLGNILVEAMAGDSTQVADAARAVYGALQVQWHLNRLQARVRGEPRQH